MSDKNIKTVLLFLISFMLLYAVSVIPASAQQNGYKWAHINDYEWGMSSLKLLIPSSWRSQSMIKHSGARFNAFFNAANPNGAETLNFSFIEIEQPLNQQQLLSIYVNSLQRKFGNIQLIANNNWMEPKYQDRQFYAAMFRLTNGRTPYLLYIKGHSSTYYTNCNITMYEVFTPYNGNNSIARARRILETAQNSETSNPQWMNLQRQIAQKSANDFAAYCQNAQQHSRAMAAQQAQINRNFYNQTVRAGETMHRNMAEYSRRSGQFTNGWINALTGKDDVYNPNDGRIYKVNSAPYHHVDQNNNIYNTNQPYNNLKRAPRVDPYGRR